MQRQDEIKETNDRAFMYEAMRKECSILLMPIV